VACFPGRSCRFCFPTDPMNRKLYTYIKFSSLTAKLPRRSRTDGNHGRPNCCLPRRRFPRPVDTHVCTGKPMKSQRERMLDCLREPKWRLVRIPAGALLLLGGIVGFLPLVGFWMVPLGLAILAIDIPVADRLLRKLIVLFRWLRRFYHRCNGPPSSRS
jgi:hypothetical protein